jgi:spore maturation protein CgeB
MPELGLHSRVRILILDSCYPAFLEAHYARTPSLESGSYDEQWRSLMGTFFGTSDAYSHFLGELGHTTREVVVNCTRMQRAWLRENGGGAGTDEDVLLRQAAAFEPDVVYVQNLHLLSDDTLAGLRRASGFVAGQIASAAPPPERLRRFDLILTSFPHLVDDFRRLGVRSEYFRIGFDPRVPEALGPEGSPTREVVFVGALNALRHRRGNRALTRAARHLPVEFWGYDLRGRPPWSPIRRRYHGQAWGLEMYALLRSARIVLNRHIAEAGPFANNMRLYEATGVGSLLLTDAKVNLPDLFAPGREVVVYETADDLVERARHFLAHEDERAAIARAGQARTLRDHTYAVRMVELAEILERNRP